MQLKRKRQNKEKVIYIVLTLLTGIFTAYSQDRRGVGVQQNSISIVERRTALVIGNSDYNYSPLKNPANDADIIERNLSGLGFKVRKEKDASLEKMKSLIKSFGDDLSREKNTVGLFYYAGHAAQIDGQNYLIPIGAKIRDEREVESESIDLRLVLAQIEIAGNSTNILILDACRDNPFASSIRSARRGLASVVAPPGTFIAYATAPGSVAGDGEGKNGIYTQELLRFMSQPCLKIEEVFKRARIEVMKKTGSRQIPWESSSLVYDFVFKQGSCENLVQVNVPFDRENPVRRDEKRNLYHNTSPELNPGETFIDPFTKATIGVSYIWTSGGDVTLNLPGQSTQNLRRVPPGTTWKFKFKGSSFVLTIVKMEWRQRKFRVEVREEPD